MFGRLLVSFLLVFSFVVVGPVFEATAEVPIITGVSPDNPTISFSGLPANPELDKALRSFLTSCGWFDQAKPGSVGDYTLSAQQDGGTLSLALAMGGAQVASWRLPASGQPRAVAKAAVDAILLKLFKIKGICSSRIAFCAETSRGIKEVFVCDIDGGDVVQVTRFNDLCVEPCWFPDGNSIGYTKYGKGSTALIQTRLSPQIMNRRLIGFPGLNVGIAVSPNGSDLALIMSQDHMVDLYTRKVNGGTLTRLTKGKAVEASPCWSPDGSRICFVSDESGRPQLYTISPAGGSKTKLPSAGNEAVTPDWSESNQITYATRIGGNYTVAILDMKTGKNIRSTNVPGNWESPAWAPDNRQIVCTRTEGGRASLYIIDSWSGKVRQLLATRNNLSMPSWSKPRK